MGAVRDGASGGAVAAGAEREAQDGDARVPGLLRAGDVEPLPCLTGPRVEHESFARNGTPLHPPANVFSSHHLLLHSA